MKKGFQFLVVVLLAVGLLLTGCLPATQPPFLPTAAPTPTTSAAPTATVQFSASPAPVTSAQLPELTRTHYQITTGLDDALRKLTVHEEITLTNPTSMSLEILPLAVEANLYDGAFELLNASAEGYSISTDSIESNQLRLHLKPALATNQSLTLIIEYILTLPPIRQEKSQIFGYTHRQINLTDWYPYLPVYHPVDGWLIHPPGEVGEHTVYPTANFDVELHLPQLEPALVVAASVPAEIMDGGYRYHAENARNFSWSASQEYILKTQQVGSITITSYAYPATELPARAALEYTLQAANYFSKQFGAAPRTSLSIVQADFPDGMEYDGLFFLSDRFYYGFDGSPRSYLALIAVHETAHQWWYARVGSDQALEPWLDEALCVYSELLFYEHLSPELADWWWQFRVEPYAPEGPLDATIYDFSQFTPYRNRVYLRGAQFLDELRQTLGDEAFFTALQNYARIYSGELTTRQDLLNEFSQTAQNDILPIIKNYFQP